MFFDHTDIYLFLTSKHINIVEERERFKTDFKPYEGLVRQRELCVLVCAPSNKALMVVLESYLTSIQNQKLSGHKCVLIGVEEKLDNVATSNLFKGGSGMNSAKVDGTGTLRASAHTLLHNILYPRGPSDVFVYTLSKRLAEVVFAILLEVNTGT